MIYVVRCKRAPFDVDLLEKEGGLCDDAPWRVEAVPFGGTYETLQMGAYTARVWQASRITACGAWCWQIACGPVCVCGVNSNRGVAKSAARRALQRLTRTGDAA